jgi:hypothetical protein
VHWRGGERAGTGLTRMAEWPSVQQCQPRPAGLDGGLAYPGRDLCPGTPASDQPAAARAACGDVLAVAPPPPRMASSFGPAALAAKRAASMPVTAMTRGQVLHAPLQSIRAVPHQGDRGDRQRSRACARWLLYQRGRGPPHTDGAAAEILAAPSARSPTNRPTEHVIGWVGGQHRLHITDSRGLFTQPRRASEYFEAGLNAWTVRLSYHS